MSANQARRIPLQTPAPDRHGRDESSGLDAAVLFEARPLPSDPNVRAEILAMLKEGMADAKAGRGVDVDEVLSRWDSLLAARLP